MSLDLLVCKVVEPKDSNMTYYVENSWDSSLKRIQPTGYVCVKEYRLIANCMSEKWYTLFYQTQNSMWDTKEEAEKQDCKLSEMKVIFPDQIESKLIKWLSGKGTKELSKQIRKLVEWKEVDFFYISW
jgi:hypothetical protein